MRLLALFSTFLALLLPAQAEDLQIGLSSEAVSIESNFAGTEVAVFGAIEGGDPEVFDRNGYDIVVVVQGPPSDVVVRKKERRLGIWVNGAAKTFRAVPSFYTIASTRPLEEIGDAANLKMLQLGFGNIDIRADDVDDGLPEDVYRASLTRLQVDKALFVERPQGVEFLSASLFRAQLALPSNVPIGHHRARAYLFRDGNFVITRSTLLEVAKSGFEQQTYNLAHRNGILYGIIAVLVAMFTGWLASVVFRKD